MALVKIGLIREGKTPPDRRVAFTPEQCVLLMEKFPELAVVVQPSPIRSYADAEYLAKGLVMQDDLSDCDLIVGIKEVPIDMLVEGKPHLFFSHTIKKQAANKKLMRALLDKKIQLIDYECLTNLNHQRIIGFGHYAGVVGAYNGLRAYGLRTGLFELKPAHACHDQQELNKELDRIRPRLRPIKVVTTGGGRVARGVLEVLNHLGFEHVSHQDFLIQEYGRPVYTQLHSHHYFIAKDGAAWDASHFYARPHLYTPRFVPYVQASDMLISAHYWDPRSEVYFTSSDLQHPDSRLKVIADITCDLDGSIPSTIRSSTIAEPFYGYDPVTGKEAPPFDEHVVTVMAVDNLPCELPRDASKDFGCSLMRDVVPALMGNDPDGIIERATICKAGKLMPNFSYLADYASV